MIEKIIRKYIDSSLRKKAKLKKREATFLNIAQCKTAIILFNSMKINSKQISQFVERLGSDIKVSAWGYSPKDNQERDTVSVHYLHKKDISIMGKPNQIIEKNFMSEKSDLLIDLTMEEVFPLKYLLGISQARCRCGMPKEGYDKLYDLEINIKKKSDEFDLFEQILTYLNMIKTS